MTTQNIRDNERSHVIDMIVEINQFVDQYDFLIKKAGGERTIYTSEKVMFPDILLYGDKNRKEILQGWEVKMPDTSITNSEFINDAKRKAKTLGLNTFVLWNFTACMLYSALEDDFEIIKTWNQNSFIKTRDDVEKYSKEWQSVLRTVILEISIILSGKNVSPKKLEDLIIDNIMYTIVEDNKENLSSFLKEKSITNNLVETKIQVWWRDASIEFNMDESDMFEAYSKVVLINWINKFLFANLIKNFHVSARKVEDINFGSTPEEAIDIFNEITIRSDYYHVFTKLDLSEMLPEKSWRNLISFNQFLVEHSIEKLDYAILQDLLESSVSASKREIAGFYTTPTTLAEILVKSIITDFTKLAIDPCCGSGTIAHQILLSKLHKVSSRESMNTTWASDKFEYPLQMATLGLTNEDTINEPSYVFQKNVFDFKDNDVVSIIDPKTGGNIERSIPPFSYIISNLPFVSSSRIDSYDKVYIKKITHKVRDETGVQLSQRADLYSYIIFALYDLLEESGKIGVILSNAWLGSEWGKNFVRALINYFKIEQIHLSTNKKWFSNADVIATILILERKKFSDAIELDQEILFFNWKKSLTEINENLNFKEDIINSIRLEENVNEELLDINSIALQDALRFTNIGISMNSFFHKIDWFNEVEKNLIPLRANFNVIRGERRGWDPLFYPDSGHGIEKEYIKSVLKNSRDLLTYQFEGNSEAFCCSLSKEELKYKKHFGALQWIDKFENEVNTNGHPLPEVLAKPNLYWYEMKDNATADIVTTMNPGNRLYFSKAKKPTFINQRLIGLQFLDERYPSELDKEVDFALLNSLIGLFLLEANGFGRGLGALDISKTSVSQMYMLNSRKLTDQDKKNITESFRKISNNLIVDLVSSLDDPDRVMFDKQILQSFGIEHLYLEIKESLLSLHRSRVNT